MADHSLVVIVLKKPEVSLDNVQGQTQFYSHWAKVPFYVMTNGKELLAVGPCHRRGVDGRYRTVTLGYPGASVRTLPSRRYLLR